MRGRKKLVKTEKKHPITVFVKAKNHAKAKKSIERIIATIESNEDGRIIGLAGGENNTDK